MSFQHSNFVARKGLSPMWERNSAPQIILRFSHSTTNSSTRIELNNTNQNQQIIEEDEYTNIQVGTEQSTLIYLITKFTDLAMENEGIGLIIASAIATSIIFYAVAKSAAELIRAWRSDQ